VLLLVTEGLTDAEIAARLSLSTRTVGHHVSVLLDKLGVGSRREAAALARRFGIVSVKRWGAGRPQLGMSCRFPSPGDAL
jgi:hypothetical protein